MKTNTFIVALIIALLPILSLAGFCNIVFSFPGLKGARISLYDPDEYQRVGTQYGDHELVFNNVPTPPSGTLHALINHQGLFKPVYDIPCHDGGLYVVDDIVGDVQVEFPGVTPDFVRIYPGYEEAADIMVAGAENPQDLAQFSLLKGFPYNIRLREGPTYLEKPIVVIRNVTIVNGLVCDIVIFKDQDEIKRIVAKTVESDKVITEMKPDGVSREIRISTLKTILVISIETTKTIKTIITNCTNTTTPIPVPGVPCNVTLDWGGLRIDNITVFPFFGDEVTYFDENVPNNLTLDLVSDQNYYAIIYNNGCPLNVSFNCSTPEIFLSLTIQIRLNIRQMVTIEIICVETGAVVASSSGDDRDHFFELLIGTYEIRLTAGGTTGGFPINMAISPFRQFVYAGGFLFPYDGLDL